MQHLVYAVAFLSSLGQSLVALAMPLMAIERFGALNFHLGLLAACGSGLYTVMALISGHVSERLPARFHLPGCTFVLAVSYYLMFHVPSFTALILLNLLNGMTTGLLWAPIEGVLSRLSSPARMRRNVGRYNLSWSLGMAAGFYLFSHITQMAFQVGAALVFATGLMLLFLRAPHAGWRPDDETCKGAARRGDPYHRFFLMIAWSGLFAAYVGVAAVRQLFPKLITELSISPAVMGRVYGIGVVAQTIAMASMGRFEGWHYRKEAFFVGGIGMFIGTMIIALGRVPVVFAVGHVVVGIGMAILYSCSLYYSMRDPAHAHHNTSVHEAMIGTAATTPVLLGFLADRAHFTPLSFYIAAAVALGLLAVHLILFARAAPRRATERED